MLCGHRNQARRLTRAGGSRICARLPRRLGIRGSSSPVGGVRLCRLDLEVEKKLTSSILTRITSAVVNEVTKAMSVGADVDIISTTARCCYFVLKCRRSFLVGYLTGLFV